MMVVGLTGSIGMGKSTVAAMFHDEGVPVFDADAVVRQLQATGGALLASIEAAFPGMTGPAGVDRAALGVMVFGAPEQLARLEAIVHPAVAEVREKFLAEHRDAPLVVIDIPLLFEKADMQQLDAVIVVSAPADAQRARVLARPGMTAEKFEQILRLQTPDAEKRARADHVIDTGTSLADTRARVSALIACLKSVERR